MSFPVSPGVDEEYVVNDITYKYNGAAWDIVALQPATDVDDKLALKANIASPTFTGTVGLPVGQTVDDIALTGSITEQQVAKPDLAIEPDNGTVQYHNITANETWTDGLADGQSMTLVLINALTAAVTITFPTMKWAGVLPTFTDDDTLTFYKINGVLRATCVANVSA